MNIRKTKFRWYGQGCRRMPFSFIRDGRLYVGDRPGVDILQELQLKNQHVVHRLDDLKD